MKNKELIRKAAEARVAGMKEADIAKELGFSNVGEFRKALSQAKIESRQSMIDAIKRIPTKPIQMLSNAEIAKVLNVSESTARELRERQTN